MGKTHFVSLLEKKLTTLLNALYCEEVIYRHPYRKCLSLKEWKLTYAKSMVDFSSDFKISENQFETLNTYAERIGLRLTFDEICFVKTKEGSYKLSSERGIEQLYAFIQQSHINNAHTKNDSFFNQELS